VLVVDDLEDARVLIGETLLHTGFLVRTAEEALEALIAAYEWYRGNQAQDPWAKNHSSPDGCRIDVRSPLTPTRHDRYPHQDFDYFCAIVN
jgi:CheY-like chemotaxis protein